MSMGQTKLRGFYKRTSSILIYMLIFIFFFGKMAFYQEYVGNFPDEYAHLGYIAYLRDSKKIIPDFENIYYGAFVKDTYSMCEVEIDSSHSNYLGHPPLYYLIMQLSNGITVADGTVFVNVNQLRNFSQLIACLALLLAFYIGLTRLKNNALHLLYGLSITSIPMLAYDCAGINNDTLCFLGVTIVFLALLRFSEEKRDLCSYLLLAAGIFISVMAKLTGGLIVMIACVLYLISVIFKEKSFKILWNKKFIITVPIYFIVFLYFVYIILCYGTVQPSLKVLDPEFYLQSNFYVPVESRINLSFTEYLMRYIRGFLSTWTTIWSHVSLPKNEWIFGKSRIVLGSILFLPILAFAKKNSRSHNKIAAQCLYIGTMLAIVYQFYSIYTNYYSTGGYLGGYQSRYYLCVLPAVAYLICQAVGERYEYAISCTKEGSWNKKIISIFFIIIIILFCALLIYEDFIYFRIHFNNYL